MSKADTLLSRLEKVRQTSRGSWIACCPHHDDKTPSMTIRETDDDRVLMHCFAGCSVEQIIGAVGLGFDAIMPDSPIDNHVKPLRRPFNAADVLAALHRESMIVSVCAYDMGRGIVLSDVDRERLLLAASRLREGAELAVQND